MMDEVAKGEHVHDNDRDKDLNMADDNVTL